LPELTVKELVVAAAGVKAARARAARPEGRYRQAVLAQESRVHKGHKVGWFVRKQVGGEGIASFHCGKLSETGGL